MNTIAIIPARYGSSRFPGKPLAMLGDMPLVQWAYTNASNAFSRVVVATDDARIYDAVRGFSGEAIITAGRHPNGTSRVLEAYRALGAEADVVVNYQGDEPFVSPESLRALIDAFNDDSVKISTLAVRVAPDATYRVLSDKDSVKVVLDANGDAMYFSRSVIPAVRGADKDRWASLAPYYKHLGVYAYRASVLEQIVNLPPTTLEEAESLEQLRWLQHGYKVRVAIASGVSLGIDTPADLAHANSILNKNIS